MQGQSCLRTVSLVLPRGLNPSITLTTPLVRRQGRLKHSGFRNAGRFEGDFEIHYAGTVMVGER